jgi:hypothetical protein
MRAAMNGRARALVAGVTFASVWVAAGCQAPYLLSESGSSTWSGLFVVPSGSTITVDYRVSGTCSFRFTVGRAVPGVGTVPGTEMDGPDLSLSGETRTGSWQAPVQPGSYTMDVRDGSGQGNGGCVWSITVH